jgi:hypothetical protein
MKFLFKKRFLKISAVFFSSVFGHQIPGSGLDPDPDSLEMMAQIKALPQETDILHFFFLYSFPNFNSKSGIYLRRHTQFRNLGIGVSDNKEKSCQFHGFVFPRRIQIH